MTYFRSPIAPSLSSFVLVPSSWTTTPGPAPTRGNRRRKAAVRDDMQSRPPRPTSVIARQDPVEDRPAADGQEGFGDVVGQRTETGRVPARENDRLQAATASRREPSYGARWMPRSVTIAETRSAGVTSKAGFRAGKRSVSSAGSRSSMGISAPVLVAKVDGRGRGNHVEGNLVEPGEHRERIRPDLVRRIAVGSDAIGAGDDQVDLARSHQRCGRGVRDHRVRHTSAASSSHAVSLAPCSSGLVSSTHTRASTPRSQAVISAPTALP